MKIALLEISHWHFPLYIEDLLSSGVDIIALSDKNEQIRNQYGHKFNCSVYSDWRQLLLDNELDAVFAFGEHHEMLEIGTTLINKGIPFSIEKPGGKHYSDVRELRKAADQKNVPISVPLVQRFGPLKKLIDHLIKEEGAHFTSTSWRFNAGPPRRYDDIYCKWMLDPNKSGGGCLINLAPHFIDLALHLMPNSADLVFAQTDKMLHGTAVEDTALICISSRSGGQAVIETGYNFPDSLSKREYSFSLVGQKHYVQSNSSGVTITRPGKVNEYLKMDLDSDPLYGVYTNAFIETLAQHKKVKVGLSELESAMKIVESAYASAQSGQSIKV